MNIILSGYGKMGRLIESRALEKGYSIAAVIDPNFGKEKTALGSNVFKSAEDALKNVPKNSVAIDFTHPGVVFANIKMFAEHKVPQVVGTTGWESMRADAEKIIANNGSSLLWSSNFSLGVNLFYKIVSYTASLIDNYAEYDAAGYEFHHNQKADSPSGTAKKIAGIVLQNMKRKTEAVYDKLDRQPKTNELHFASVRCGTVPGTHALIFDSLADTIEIKHTVRSREGLVSGALAAAEWLSKKIEKGNGGIFTMDDVLA